MDGWAHSDFEGKAKEFLLLLLLLIFETCNYIRLIHVSAALVGNCTINEILYLVISLHFQSPR